MVAIWDFDDPDYFTTERMQSISDICGGSGTLSLSPEVIISTLKQILGRVREFRIVRFFLAVVIFCAVLAGKKRYCPILAAGLFFIIILGEYWYLVNLHRVYWRAEYGIWVCAGLLLLELCLYEPAPVRIRHAAESAALALILLLCLKSGYSLWNQFALTKNYKIVNSDRTTLDPFFEAVKDKPEHFYMGDTKTFAPEETLPEIYSVDKRYKDYFKNYSRLGGWFTASPFSRAILGDYQIRNSMESLAFDDRVLLADAGAEAPMVSQGVAPWQL